MDADAVPFELPNAGAGPDPLDLEAFAADHDAVVLLFQRDYYCGNCREQVQAVADRYDEFRERDAAVVSVLPEPLDRAARWQDRYGLPYPLVADPETRVCDRYDQPTRLGVLGTLHDLLGRMPAVVVLNARADDLAVEYVHRGSTPGDRPTVDDLLARVDELDGE